MEEEEGLKRDFPSITMAITMTMTTDGWTDDGGGKQDEKEERIGPEEEGPVEEEGYHGVAQFGANGKNETRARTRVE